VRSGARGRRGGTKGQAGNQNTAQDPVHARSRAVTPLV
jgi:hypothetical protein